MVDDPMAEGTLSPEMSEALLRLPLGALVQMFSGMGKPTGHVWRFRIPCGSRSVMVVLNQEGELK